MHIFSDHLNQTIRPDHQNITNKSFANFLTQFLSVYSKLFILSLFIDIFFGDAFIGVAETLGSLLCCGGGIVQCLFNLLYYFRSVVDRTIRNTRKLSLLRKLSECMKCFVTQINFASYRDFSP